ncbi:MAG TPA: PAS domain S-box protein [Kofleriaceae bacterium]|nr:PAS domain S-box protein [Kofleriaceae bacterium]
MHEFWKELFSPDGFMPHGHCYLWRPELVWLHVISDGLVALAYISIPFTLLYFVRKRRDVPFHWMFLCFGTFIITCGLTHVMEIWTLWNPVYRLAGLIKAITATASLPTAILLIKLIPRALAIPTPAQLARAHDELRRAHEVLERRVLERTIELTQRNEELAREIAERKRAEEALVRSESQFRRLAEAGIIGVISSDVRGNIREANRAFLDMLDYTPEEVHAGLVRWTDMTPAEYRGLDELAIEQLRATGIAPAWEKAYFRKDGTIVPVLVGVATIDRGTGDNIAFALDLTERKRAEDAIRRLERERERDAKLRPLLDAAPDAMVIVDHDGHIVLVNAETEKMFGYPRSELLGKSVDLLVPERLRAPHAQHRNTYVDRPSGRRAMGAGQQLIARRRDGTELPVEIRLSPVHTNEGLLISSAIRDVSERLRTEHALRRAKEAAENASAELEAFSYSVAHDLRTPLRAIGGHGATLLEDYADKLDDDARLSLTRIVAGARRMGEIIDALLSLARLTRTEPRWELVDLHELAETVIGQLRAGEPDRVVEFTCDDHLVVRGDPRLLRLLLDNLLGNAWKFTSKQPAARVELGREDQDGTPVYYVRDNGAGFDMSLVGKLFAPFRRLHHTSDFEGSGIGLATVQRIVRRHGGRVWAEGAESRGATFRFTLSSGDAPGAAWAPTP